MSMVFLDFYICLIFKYYCIQHDILVKMKFFTKKPFISEGLFPFAGCHCAMYLRKNAHSSSLHIVAYSLRMSQWNTCGGFVFPSP